MVDAGAERGLIERAADGDEHAFRALYDQTVGRVHALLLRLTSNRTLAEDLTQESYLRAWRGLPKFRGDASFQTWIHRIAVRVSIEAHRRRKGRELREVDWPEEAESPGSVPAPSTLAGISLERAIATLPDGAREVFVLYEIEGFRHAEIAEMIGVATPTVRSQLHRAKTLLRKAIDR
jgi:RNA polymerase sigma-70 factor (ECF subfamily)